MTYPAAVLADSPVCYWRLGETAGTFADSGSAGLAGTAHGTMTRGSAGTILDNDGAPLLDGSTGYISVADNNALDITTPFTIEAWVKKAQASRGVNEAIVSKGTGSYYLRWRSDGHLNFVRSNQADLQITNGAYLDTNWHHCVVTFDGTTLRLYVDGIDDTAAGTPAPALVANTSELDIGRDPGSAGELLNGVIDEVAIYSTALSPARISAHYQTGLSRYAAEVLADSPSVYYRLGEPSGTTARDVARALNGLYRNAAGGSLPGLGSTGLLAGDADAAASWSTAGQEVQLANNALLNPTAAMSIECWINASSWGANRRIFAKGATDNQYRLMYDTGTSDIVFDMAGTGSIHFPAPATGGPHHVVVTYDRSFIRAYVDGSAVGTPPAAVGAIPTTTDAAAIGNKPGSTASGDQFAGTIDEVAFYGAALSATRVAAHYAAGIASASQGLAMLLLGGL